MNLVSTVTYQVVIMFLLAGIGALMFRSGKISLEGSKSIGSILVNLSLPAVIINGFLVERTPERITGLLLSALLAAVTLALAILAARVCFRKDPMAQFAAAFSNPGFFWYPHYPLLSGQRGNFLYRRLCSLFEFAAMVLRRISVDRGNREYNPETAPDSSLCDCH